MTELSMIDPEKHSPMVLTRLSSRNPGQTAWLEQALSGRLEPLAKKALEVALETGDPIGQVLAALFQRDEMSPERPIAGSLK